MPIPPATELADADDKDFELAFIAIIDDRLAGLHSEIDTLTRFRKRLVERQQRREVADGTRAS